jgi:type VI secretion system protein ImpA
MPLITPLPVAAELAALLEPVSPSAPAGRDLDGTLELSAFETLVREPETAPIAGVEWQDNRDWSAIEHAALKLLQTSRDLRVAVQLTRARLHTQGLTAFYQALCFLCELTRHQWATVYPPLDAESAEPTARVNALEELASQPLLSQLRRTRLAVAPGHAAVSIKDAIASVGNAPSDIAARVKVTLDTLGRDAIEQHLSELRGVRSALEQLMAFVLEQSDTRLQLKALIATRGERPGVLDALESVFVAAQSRAAGQANTDGETPVAVVNSAEVTPPERTRSGLIQSRHDVIATLDRVCAYYSASEPSSPVPLLLRRAQRLVPLDFLAIVRDLARTGLGDIATIAGLEAGSAPTEQARHAAHDGK